MEPHTLGSVYGVFIPTGGERDEEDGRRRALIFPKPQRKTRVVSIYRDRRRRPMLSSVETQRTFRSLLCRQRLPSEISKIGEGRVSAHSSSPRSTHLTQSARRSICTGSLRRRRPSRVADSSSHNTSRGTFSEWRHHQPPPSDSANSHRDIHSTYAHGETKDGEKITHRQPRGGTLSPMMNKTIRRRSTVARTLCMFL